MSHPLRLLCVAALVSLPSFAAWSHHRPDPIPGAAQARIPPASAAPLPDLARPIQTLELEDPWAGSEDAAGPRLAPFAPGPRGSLAARASARNQGPQARPPRALPGP
ncbi:hypothetical protein [Mesoterricola sediminis]|uniref:Uncharacterized protein n=1 Tax=Mesoterricola sediminis TaxID=2927980 RepID=A0AA48KC45_9BACT|nr:hypothetical protein [Mesoterricola sediminis]BDU76626.1 hypothetical protein METESE_15840 [Mesoterricola sediminis]